MGTMSKEYNRAYRKKNLEKRREYEKNWYRNNYRRIKKNRKFKSPQYRARQAIQYAIRTGKIVKPNNCSDCLAYFEDKKKLHGHHKDYSKPLEILWLCSVCHGLKHQAKQALKKAGA